MLFIIPLLLAIAGVAALLFRRRYLTSNAKAKQPPQVIVKGDTFSETVEVRPQAAARQNAVEDVQQCCIIGAGRIGATTGIILASKNPDIQFHIVDTNRTLIDAWNSSSDTDTLPISEPGLEEIFFDDSAISVSIPDPDPGSGINIADEVVFQKCRRRRKLPNLSFSTNIPAAVAASEVIFLCLEMDSTGPIEANPFEYLTQTLQTIASASQGQGQGQGRADKIIVQRGIAPYGVTAHIKTQLTSLSSSTSTSTPKPTPTALSRSRSRSKAKAKATFTVLTNPVYPPSVSASLVSAMLNPPRVLIGHIFSPTSSTQALSVLESLYTSVVPRERIVTMDAWSVELGCIASGAMAAQQWISLAALGRLCGLDGVEARGGKVSFLATGLLSSPVCIGGAEGMQVEVAMGGHERGVGCGFGFGFGMMAARAEVSCLVALARERGVDDLAGYWEGVLRVQERGWEVSVGRLLGKLDGSLTESRVAVVCGTEGYWKEMSAVVVRYLEEAAVGVIVWKGDPLRADDTEILLENGDVSGDNVVKGSMEDTCSGCNAVVVCGAVKVEDEIWQRIARRMKGPKILLDMANGTNPRRMRQAGFEVM
ncbi:hypothetical protein BJY04DRAFT_221273 [Aspergillus karnatakaensis]|uniref:putative UDP-glucose dehydrogenase Ugd1 n=1 Tax=Aspergillus karnatakaensis TaxID=1810916 RepID=UPI003CCDA7FE